MITIKDAEEILKKEYHIDNFLYLINDILLPDFKSDKHDVVFRNNIFESVTQLGSSAACDVTIYEVILKPGVEKRRVTITQEMFRILRGQGVNNAVVAFANADRNNYRISLLTSKYEFSGDKIVKVISNPRRYSYALGYSTKTKTAYKFLIEKGKVDSLEELTARFSVEVVNKQFYSEIATCFTELVGGDRDGRHYDRQLNLYGVTNHNKYSEFAVRLIGRIVFCWFLKEKKSESGLPLLPEQMISVDGITDNYYHTVLEPLFFELLNTNANRRKGKYAEEGIYQQIPYLNGGLFSPHNDDKYKYDRVNQCGTFGIVTIPDDWFRHFYGVLSQYNFTVDENTSYDIELSIDPEMLGRIFENLLAEINPETGENAKKSTGSFYTPRDIVDYMVDNSILEYLKTKTGIDDSRLKALISYAKEDDELAEFNNAEKRAIINALYTVTVLDPACGSGAFPIGMLQKIVYILQQVDPEANLWFEKATEKWNDIFLKKAFEKRFKEGSLDYIRKLKVIQNSIFGVDIQPIAVEIARLRCFLSLIIAEKVIDSEPNRNIEPLPSLDFKFIIANTLIPLPKGNQISVFENIDHINQLKAVRDEYFTADSERKQELKLEFAEIQKSMFQQTLTMAKMASARYSALFNWSPFKNEATAWFDPEWMFGISNGFDIVIGNPPYIDSEMMTKTMPDMRELYAEKYSCAKGNWDIYVVFIERGLDLSAKQGTICYIIPNKLISAPYAKQIRKKLSRSGIKSLRDYSSVKVFDAAVYPFVFIAHKGVELKKCEITKMKSYIEGRFTVELDTQLLVDSDNWDKYFNDNQGVVNIVNKIGTYKKLSDIAFVKGAATVSEAYDLIDGISEYNEDSDFFKLINTGTIDPYLILWGEYKTQYIKHQYYKPIVKKEWLQSRMPVRFLDASSEKIIVAGMSKILECCYDNGEVLAGKSTTIILRSQYPIKYILGILNSKLMTFYYQNNFTSLSLAGGFYRVGVPQIKELPIAFNEAIANKIADKVNCLLYDNNLSIKSEIDQLVYELYGLTQDEISIVEQSAM